MNPKGRVFPEIEHSTSVAVRGAVAWIRPVTLRTQSIYPFTHPRMSALPFKRNADRRHHIPKKKRKVTNAAA